jgi:urease accessory protein
MEPFRVMTLVLSRRLPPEPGIELPVVELDSLARERTRLRVEVAGTAFAILLEPGPPLSDGELLGDATGARLRVRAAVEDVVVAAAGDACLRARAAWHLGNRHTPVQIVDDLICFRPDHVLEDMVRRLGLDVRRDRRTFIPEAGAYHGAGASLVHGHSHASGHTRHD